jgi:hypothetical protein
MLGAAALTFPVSGQSGFIIENADATNTLSFTSSTELSALISQIAPRFVVEFAHANQYYALTAMPTALNDLLTTLQPRFVIEFARANKYYALTPVPSQLNTLLGQIAPRFVLEFAKANSYITLSFPVALINDTTPPQGSNITVKPAGETSTTITWATDEYADSTVRCGTQSGNYTMTFSDPLYVKQHSITLTDLTPGTTYYCVCSSTDQSGNTYQSQEFSFEQAEETFIYLPLVLRNR